MMVKLSRLDQDRFTLHKAYCLKDTSRRTICQQLPETSMTLQYLLEVFATQSPCKT